MRLRVMFDGGRCGRHGDIEPVEVTTAGDLSADAEVAITRIARKYLASKGVDVYVDHVGHLADITEGRFEVVVGGSRLVALGSWAVVA